MNKFLPLMIVALIFAGCSHTTGEESSIEPKELQGYLGVLDKTNKSARGDIDDAVNTQNAQLEGALGVLDDDVSNNSINNKTMDETNFDMSFAQTCKGAKITTNQGIIEVTFDGAAAPKAVANFCTLASKNFYDGVIFHRVIKDFMIQGGDPDGIGTGGPGYTFEDELPAAGSYKIGSLAMANAGPNTNGSQFFIVSGAAGVGLPPAYTLFGQVQAGLDVVEKIQNVPTAAGDKPVEDVVIKNVDLIIK